MSSQGPEFAELPLTVEQRGQLSKLLDVLIADEHSPTAIRDRSNAATLHIRDSLAALEVEGVRTARRIADLGSGAGFPGLPLAVALADAEMNLIESQRRKCEFLARALTALELENVRVVCSRVEEWEEGMGTLDLVIARALAAQPVVVEYAAPLLRVKGLFVDWRGRRDREEERKADAAAAIVGLRRVQVAKATLGDGASEHHLHVFMKMVDTPNQFPRRAGMARKRPLGG